MSRITCFTIAIAAWIIGAAATSILDTEAMPTPYIAVGNGGHVYFRMLPDPDEPWNRDKGRGRAYRVGSESDELLWEVEGWYSYRVFLSDRGRYLVRMGPWPRGREPSEDHLAVAFYDNGNLLKKYSTRALIKDDSKLRPSVSHYDYLSETSEPRFIRTPTDGYWPLHWFQLTTVDGITYTFDRRTGEIVKSEVPDAGR